MGYIFRVEQWVDGAWDLVWVGPDGIKAREREAALRDAGHTVRTLAVYLFVQARRGA